MRADYINPSVYSKVYHLLTYENALALRLSLETGLRISDVLKTELKDLQGQNLSFVAQKTGKEGKKRISADLAKRLRKISGERWIFTGRSGLKPRTRQAVWKDVKKAARKLEVKENMSVHSARKTYGVEVFHEGGINAAQRELQHSRLDNTMLYAFSDFLTGGKSLTGTDPEIKRLMLETHTMVKEIYYKNFPEEKPQDIVVCDNKPQDIDLSD